jgi:mannosyltransferase OCH1-like enzyme
MNVIILIILFIFLFLLLNNQKFKNVYKIKGYTDLKNDSSIGLTPGGISKIIIKTSWQTRDSMPIQMINVLEKTKSTSPDYQLYYFDDSECEEFMKDYSPRVFKAYNKVIPGAFKADLFRICILEK